jgi:hypothetical protein
MGIIDNAKEIVGLIKKIDDVELYRKIVELEGEIIELTRENRDLKKKLDDIETLEAQLHKYQLEETPGGAVVYGFNGSPKHYACPSCINKKELHILQDMRSSFGRFICPGCEKTFPVKKQHEDPTDPSYHPPGTIDL